MLKLKVLSRVTESGLVAIVRTDSPDQAARIADACAEGGVAALEITFTVPGAAAVIAELTKRYKPEQMVIGAGTVLDPETARIAILAGAQFLVSPAVSAETARLANRYQVPYMPGADNVRDVVEAMECGADIVKVFPGEVLGPEFIKAVKAPLPQASLMPTGGVSIENAATWIKAGAVALGSGRKSDRGREDRRLPIDHRAGEAIYRGDSRGARKMNGRVVTFGEIMLRLAPPGFERFLQSPQFVATFGGGEANVAVALASLGVAAEYVTVLPDKNPMADAAIGELRRFGVETPHIARGKGRMGIYFLEAGASQRASKVVYDREGSSTAIAKAGSIDWASALEGAGWFHIYGDYSGAEFFGGGVGDGGFRESPGGRFNGVVRFELSQEPLEMGQAGGGGDARPEEI